MFLRVDFTSLHDCAFMVIIEIRFLVPMDNFTWLKDLKMDYKPYGTWKIVFLMFLAYSSDLQLCFG